MLVGLFAPSGLEAVWQQLGSTCFMQHNAGIKIWCIAEVFLKPNGSFRNLNVCGGQPPLSWTYTMDSIARTADLL